MMVERDILKRYLMFKFGTLDDVSWVKLDKWVKDENNIKMADYYVYSISRGYYAIIEITRIFPSIEKQHIVLYRTYNRIVNRIRDKLLINDRFLCSKKAVSIRFLRETCIPKRQYKEIIEEVIDLGCNAILKGEKKLVYRYKGKIEILNLRFTYWDLDEFPELEGNRRIWLAGSTRVGAGEVRFPLPDKVKNNTLQLQLKNAKDLLRKLGKRWNESVLISLLEPYYQLKDLWDYSLWRDEKYFKELDKVVFLDTVSNDYREISRSDIFRTNPSK